MQHWLKETLFVTLATWVIDCAIDHWAFGHQHSAYHLASLMSALAVGGMFFLWRFRERQYHREIHAFELRRRARQHTLSNKLQVIAVRAGHDPQVESATREIAKLIQEPILEHCPNKQNCICDFVRKVG
jgi:hypothetical protein